MEKYAPKIFFIATLLLSSVAFNNAFADYSRYSPITINFGQETCMSHALEVAKASGIKEAKKNSNTEISGANASGYSIQFVCLANKKIAVVVINGPNPNEKNRIFNYFYENMKK